MAPRSASMTPRSGRHEGIRGGYASAKQNFPRKTGTAAVRDHGLPLDAQMQQNRLDVDERVEGSRQCSCSCSSWLARAARPIQVLQMQHLQGIHTYGEGSNARRTARSASATRRERWQRGCYLKKSCLFRRGVVHIYWGKNPTSSCISNTGLIDGAPLPILMGFTTFVTH
jgi:hypothetical protein